MFCPVSGKYDDSNTDFEYVTTVEPTALLTEASGFFRSMVVQGSNFIEGQTGTVVLTETNPFVWKLFVDWIQSGDLIVKLPLDANEIAEHEGFGTGFRANKDEIIEEDQLIYIDRFVELYILADFLNAPEVQNEVLSSLFLNLKAMYEEDDFLPIHYVMRINDSLSERNPLRRLIMDCLVFNLSNKTRNLALEVGLIDEEVAKEVERGYNIPLNGDPWRQYTDNPFRRSLCAYHIHHTWEEEVTCWGRNTGSMGNLYWKER